MFPDFWTSDSVFRRMIVQLRRTAFLNKIYSPRGVDFCPLSLKAVWRPPLFYFISWVYIYWITSSQTFTKIWVQVLFEWNDLKAHANGRNKCQQLPTLLGVVGQQCCVHLHEPKSLTDFKLYTTSDNKCQHCCGFIQTDATSHNIVGPTMLGVGGQQCWVSFEWAFILYAVWIKEKQNRKIVKTSEELQYRILAIWDKKRRELFCVFTHYTAKLHYELQLTFYLKNSHSYRASACSKIVLNFWPISRDSLFL